jgi:hypothetical protein
MKNVHRISRKTNPTHRRARNARKTSTLNLTLLPQIFNNTEIPSLLTNVEIRKPPP